MSVHFFYDFRDDLVKKLKENYSGKLEILKKEKQDQAQIEDARNIILTYFGGIREALDELIEASDGDIEYVSEENIIAKLQIDKNFIQFTRMENRIQVKLGYYVPEADLIEEVVISNIVPGDKKCRVKKIGKVHDGGSFEESTIDYYLREAFAKTSLFGYTK
jgi:hypothetical protein